MIAGVTSFSIIIFCVENHSVAEAGDSRDLPWISAVVARLFQDVVSLGFFNFFDIGRRRKARDFPQH